VQLIERFLNMIKQKQHYLLCTGVAPGADQKVKIGPVEQIVRCLIAGHHAAAIDATNSMLSPAAARSYAGRHDHRSRDDYNSSAAIR